MHQHLYVRRDDEKCKYRGEYAVSDEEHEISHRYIVLGVEYFIKTEQGSRYRQIIDFNVHTSFRHPEECSGAE
jgi:hypothetical protein